MNVKQNSKAFNLCPLSSRTVIFELDLNAATMVGVPVILTDLQSMVVGITGTMS